MRNFHIPFDMHTEDKIIGGYLSLRQFVWLLAGCFVGIYLIFMNKAYIGENGDINVFRLAIRIIISLVFIGAGVFLSFFKLEEMDADTYFFKMINWKSKPRIIKYTDKKM